VKNVTFVIPLEQQRQIKGMINYYLETRNPEVGNYLSRFAKVIQSIDDFYVLENIPQNQYNLTHFDPVNRSPYGRFNHGDANSKNKNKRKTSQIGMLSGELGDCCVRNIDLIHRLVFKELEPGIVGIVNVLGHYDKCFFNNSNVALVKRDLEILHRDNPSDFQFLKKGTEEVLSFLFATTESIKDIEKIENLDQVDFKAFNDKCTTAIFPLSIDYIIRELERSKNSIVSNTPKITMDKTARIKVAEAQENIGDLIAGIDGKDSEVYKVMRNTMELSVHLAESSGNKDDLDKVQDIIDPNLKLVDKCSFLIEKYAKYKNIFSDAAQFKDLNELKLAIKDSVNFTLNNDFTSSVVSTFREQVYTDVTIISNQLSSGKDDGFTFKNTILFSETLNEKILNKQSKQQIQYWLMNECNAVSYYNVPFENRKEAKILGMEWDRKLHHWYASNSVDQMILDDKGWSKVSKITLENEKQERDKLREELMVEKDNQNQKITQSNSIDSAKKKGRSR